MNDIKIYAKADREYVIDILGDIGEDFWGESQNTKQVINAKIKEITAIDADTVHVNISSLGGSVDHGLAIHDALSSLKAKVITNVTGLTASAATIIAQAGDVRRMSDNSLYLIHRAWTFAMGNADDMVEMASTLEKIDDRILSIYTKKSGKDKDKIWGAMQADQFLSPDEALALGLVDEVYEPSVKVAASVSSVQFEAIKAFKQKAAEQIAELVVNKEESTQVEAQALDTERERLSLQVEAQKLKYQLLNESKL